MGSCARPYCAALGPGGVTVCNGIALDQPAVSPYRTTLGPPLQLHRPARECSVISIESSRDGTFSRVNSTRELERNILREHGMAVGAWLLHCTVHPMVHCTKPTEIFPVWCGSCSCAVHGGHSTSRWVDHGVVGGRGHRCAGPCRRERERERRRPPLHPFYHAAYTIKHLGRH